MATALQQPPRGLVGADPTDDGQQREGYEKKDSTSRNGSTTIVSHPKLPLSAGPKISQSDAGVRGKIASASGRDKTTRLQDIRPGSQGQRGPGVLLDEQNRNAGCVDGLNRAEDVVDDPRRQPQGRLVQQKQAGTAHEGPGQSQHLSFAAG
jgi:hypothetical protein